MRTLVACNNQTTAQLIEKYLQRDGVPAEALSTWSLKATLDHVVQQRPELLIFVLPEDVDSAISLLHEIKPLVPSTRLMVVGPASDPKLILRVLKEGVEHYLDIEELETELSAGLARARYRPANNSVKEEAHVISVVGVAGGCGASTVAANCATSLATAHGSCGLVDLDLETGDLGPLLNLEPRYSVADFCRNIGRMDSAMFEQCFIRHSSGVELIAAPLRYREIGDVTPDGVRRLLRMARSRFPYVVIDQRQTYRPDQAQALFQSHRIVLVLRDDFTSLRHTSKTIGYFEDIGIDTRRVVYVCNRCGQSRQLGSKEVESALAAKVSCRIPDAPRQVNHASNKGHPVVLDYPRSGVAKSLNSLAQLLNGVATN